MYSFRYIRYILLVFLLAIPLRIYSNNKSFTKKDLIQTSSTPEQKSQQDAAAKLTGMESFEKIHTAPIILVANKDLNEVQYYPLEMYRLFRTAEDGKTPIPIPFQIDEKDNYNDYVLDRGTEPNTKFSNNVFDNLDELSLMGNDVGQAIPPKNWQKIKKPTYIYEILFEKNGQKGAVYLGIYTKHTKPKNLPPKNSLSDLKYVVFNLNRSEILTSKYRYHFKKKNYLIVRDVFLREKNKKEEQKVLDSSTFFAKINFKYFLTFYISESLIDSELEAYKSGPIRTIARINFNLNLLRINIDLGMYTEISFFSNALTLPAEIEIPFDGNKSLNKDSVFYYGYASVENPKNLQIESNMPLYNKQKTFNLNLFNKTLQKESIYWLTALSPDFILYLDFKPSKQMLESNTVPRYYVENIEGEKVANRSKGPKALGESNINLAVSFDMQKLEKGMHEILFRIFIDTLVSKKKLEQFKSLSEWKTKVKKI